MSATSFELSKRLNQGPAVLFLGQNYLRNVDTGSDPFLDQIFKKYSGSPQLENYDQILQLRLPSPETFLSWARERTDQYVITPPWLPIVAKFAWNNVYTSAIDTLWYKNFRTEWRELFPIYLEKIKPAEIRSSGILNCTFLFGCIDQPADDPNFRPPLSTLEKNKRKQEAIALLRRLPEIVTPFGTLVIEGYDGFTDWIGWDDILPIVDSLQPGQTHFFSMSEDVLQHPDIQELAKQQKIIFHLENLASYFVENSSEIKMGLLKEDVEGKKRIAIGEKVLYVPHELFNSISRTATVVDDSIFEPLPILQSDGVYIEFRRFLANSSKRPVWSGYYWGFNFKRDFETKLMLTVNQEINSVSLQKSPIIIHGPSGTGKTVALGSLAFEIRKNNRCAVLFIERKPARPSYADLDEFSAWAEHSGSPVTLIVWDGMVEEDEYSKLLSYLTGRGRKVVIVGSCYEIVSIPKQAKNYYVYAGSDFSDEISRFESHMIKITPAFKQVIGKIHNTIDPYFLVMLYRMLPETAAQLQDGIINEANFAQHKLVAKATKENIPENSLAHYFLEVGLISEEDLSLTKQVIVNNEEITEVEKLIGLIMVPGRFGLNVPVELIVRAMNRTWLQTFTDLLGEISIFNMDFDEHTGVVSVGPRHTLEAKFIVERRMGGSAATEVDYASKLLLELSSSAEIDSYEFQFAVDLIRKMGPNGDDKTYFAPHFKTLSTVLEELRTKRGIINPRLMLQEAVLLREWLKNIDIRVAEPISDEERLQTYHKAAQILDKAYKDSSPSLRSTILSELAANLGAENKVNISRGSVKDALATYEKAKSSIIGALKYTPADYHPLDVVAWMSEDLIVSNLAITDSLRAELAADWFHLFSMADENEYSDQQRVLYNSKMATLARIIDNRDLLEKSLEMLEEIGSKAGYYLQAFWIIRDHRKRTRKSSYLLLPTNEPAKDDDIPGYINALKFLEDHEKEIGIDGRCLSLKFKLWWLIKTKKPLFLHERERLAFTLDDWKYLLNLMNRLLETSDLFYPTPIKYTKALALFHLGNYTEMLELFREIDRESAQNGKGPKRIFRHYLASNEKGEPIQYSGRILWIDLVQDRGQVYVPTLSRPITFIPRDFPRWSEMRKDQPLPAFHIAFNFIGPVADPVSRFHKNR